MQHHTHPSPHMRAGHILTTMHSFNMPPSEQQKMLQGHQKFIQQQQQQQQQQKPPMPAPSNNNNIGPHIGPHLREHQHNNRLNHTHQALHATTQMQKIRQQHQHLNHTNNDSSYINKPQQQQQQYNHATVLPTHLAAAPPPLQPTPLQQQQPPLQQQQHRNLAHHPQQQQQHMQAHLKQSGGISATQQQQQQYHHHHMANNNLHKQQQQQQQHQKNVNNSYYPGGNNNNNKHKYHNNNNTNNTTITTVPTPSSTAAAATTTSNNYMTPKTILQNPNRVLKTVRTTTLPTTTTAAATAAAAAAATTTTTAATITTTATSTTAVNVTNKNSNNNNNKNTTNNSGITTSNNNNNNSNIKNNNTNSISTLTSTTPIVSANTNVELSKSTEHKEETETGDNSKESTTTTIAEESTTIAESSSESVEDATLSNDHGNESDLAELPETTITKRTKDKTPMCLVNELARFNRITHQYRLTSEMGPAHSKRFQVTLKLGEEEYTAEGFKIKKAQHLAAAAALEKTKYKHPAPKYMRHTDEYGTPRPNITPTVELNALAMKLGQQTYYLFDPRQVPPTDAVRPPPPNGLLPAYGPPPNAMLPPHVAPPQPLPPPHPHPHHAHTSAYMRRNGIFPPPPPASMIPHLGHGGHGRKFSPRHAMFVPRGGGPYHMQPPPPPPFVPNPPLPPCKITLIVGKQRFVGIGRSVQQAKHDAASHALQVLRTQATNQLNEMLNNTLEDTDSKSPISLVHETAIKRNMSVMFKVLREEGPAHMKNFITACIVGDIVTEGEGPGKKLSKKRAAEKMLDEMKKLPPISPSNSPVKRIKMKVPSRNVSTATATTTNVDGDTAPTTNNDTATPASQARPFERRKRNMGNSIQESNLDSNSPVTKLVQLLQNRKEKEPVFELITKNGSENARHREFVMEVTAQGMVARGTGNSKKIAKRNAAMNLLIALDAEPGSESAKKQDTNAPNETTPDNSKTATNPFKATTSVKSSTSFDVSGKTPATASTSNVKVPRRITRSQSQAKRSENIQKNNTTATTTTTIIANEATKEEHSTTNDTLDVNETTNTSANETTESSDNDIININASSCSANSSSSTNNSSNNNTSNATSSNSCSVHMKDQLLYLAKLLGFEVNFSDYPKGNHNEFLTIVTLSTNPPQICHGVGTNSEESQNDAAKNALKILSELGLNNATK